MSLDLDLLPFWRNDDFSLEVLHIVGAADLEKPLRKLPALPVPPTFKTYVAFVKDKDVDYPDEWREMIGDINTMTMDAYDEQLLFTTAQQLKTLSKNKYVQMHRQNRAVWAYLNELDDGAYVALYWH